MSLANEKRAFEAWIELLASASKCQSLFDAAGVPYPPALKRLFEIDSPAGKARRNGGGGPGTAKRPARRRRKRPTARTAATSAKPSLGESLEASGLFSRLASASSFSVAPPPSPPSPAGVRPGWIYVPIPALLAQTVALGILRGQSGPLPLREVKAGMEQRGIHVNDGTIANMGTRLSDRRKIERSEGGWRLLRGDDAPILNGRFAWGSPEVFNDQERSIYRREVVLHVLRTMAKPLKRMQLLAILEQCQWFQLPVTKDALKADLAALETEGKIRECPDHAWVVVENSLMGAAMS